MRKRCFFENLCFFTPPRLTKPLFWSIFRLLNASPSSRGLGHRVLIPATWVRIPLEMPFFYLKIGVSYPCKKQAAVWKIKFSHCCFFFLPVIFAFAKMGLLTYGGLPCVTRPAVCVTHAHFVVPSVWRLAPPMLTHLPDLRFALLTHPANGVVEFCYAHHFFVFFPDI